MNKVNVIQAAVAVRAWARRRTLRAAARVDEDEIERHTKMVYPRLSPKELEYVISNATQASSSR